MNDTEVKGVRWGVAEAGIRKRGGLDLGVILLEEPTALAAVFTKSETAAAPVRLSRARARGGRAAAVLVNAGCANACTPDGEQTARSTAAALAEAIGAPEKQVLVASTGVIGASMPEERMIAAIPTAVADASEDGLPRFARAIMTTDTFPKVASRRAGRAVVAGCAKGAGMIMPDMATLLGFLATDAAASPARLRAILREAVRASFNAVTVDGDTSTNDTVLLLATGRSGVEARPGTRAARALEKAVFEVALDLAKSIARDGEGATKAIEVTVEGARSEREADAVARRIANSPLVKTALHAADANWGRIAAAAGTAGVRFDSKKLAIRIGDAVVARRGVSTGAEAESQAVRHLAEREVRLAVSLGSGRASRTVFTCDLSADYVRINAEYRT